MKTTQDCDRRRWQHVAYKALGELLRADLPAIDWTVGVHASLVARVERMNRADTADVVRARWQVWADYLRAETTSHEVDGVLELVARADLNDFSPPVQVAVTATIYLDDPAGLDEPTQAGA